MLMTITAARILRIRDELNAGAGCPTTVAGENRDACTCALTGLIEMIKSHLNHIVILLFLSVTLLVSARSEGKSDERQDVDYHGSDCIWIRSIRDYRPLDDQTLLIWAVSRKLYLVRLMQRSMDMRSTIGMSVISRDEQLCPYGGDRLKFGTLDSFPANVRSIARITTDQAEQLLVRYGKKSGSEPPPPAPREVEGAEVEELD